MGYQHCDSILLESIHWHGKEEINVIYRNQRDFRKSQKGIVVSLIDCNSVIFMELTVVFNS